ncbi:RadC family protein [Spartinivicinus poritis]|uniref:DNA repair protein RadC n=1 Tax=Spartinivicinus poritis TaxID=2994640 RepID=A0ABT5UB14_9GAMM|nr:DNA repair protein RadC [Spartinivicinus sp. A2-2]MDE1463568.1 DNA repair protein RadC [Spartinivicinus sp. A2-2]
MAITNWDKSEQPREKLLTHGPKHLSDAELLAIFLRTGIPGKSAVDLAREMISQFGGLNPLLEANQSQFCSIKGMGAAKYVQLQAVLEMARRYFWQSMSQKPLLNSSDTAKNFIKACLQPYQREVFGALMLNSQNQVIEFKELFFGTISSAAIYPREVAKAALVAGARHIILAHNHPSGSAEPSQADVEITTNLKEALELIEVSVIDHLVIGDNKVVSLAELGYI